MTPMNLVSEIAQPISMAFRHFGNVVGGSVITSMLYMALLRRFRGAVEPDCLQRPCGVHRADGSWRGPDPLGVPE